MYGILFSIVVQGKQAVKADGTPVSTFMVYIYPYYFRNCITLHYSNRDKKSKFNHVLLRHDKISSAKKRGTFCNIWTR